MGVLNDVSGVIVYHVVRIPKRQYEVNEPFEFPISERDFSSAPSYKQEAENLLEQARLNEFLNIHHEKIVYLLPEIVKIWTRGFIINIEMIAILCYTKFC